MSVRGMTAFEQAMTGLRLAMIGMSSKDARYYQRLAAQLQAYETRLRGSRHG